MGSVDEVVGAMTPESYDVRVLADIDAAGLRGLLGVFGDAFEDRARYCDKQPNDTYLAELLAKPTFIAIVADNGGEVVGGLTAYVLDKPEQTQREIYIYDLAVSKHHRRRGLATRLIGRLQHVGAEIGAHVIFVQADLEDAPAIALYQKLGSQETAHHFDIDVPEKIYGINGTAPG